MAKHIKTHTGEKPHIQQLEDPYTDTQWKEIPQMQPM